MLDQSNSDFRAYYQIFLRNRKLFMVPFVVVFCLVSLSILFFPKVYESKTVVRVQKKQPNPIGDDRLVREEKLTARLKTLEQMVLSRPLLSQTIRKLNLDKDVDDAEDMEKLLQKIRGGVSIKVKGDELFSVGYEHSNPEQAMQVVTTIVNNFIDENLSMKRDEAFASVDFIQKQRSFLENHLMAWVPEFAKSIIESAESPFYQNLAKATSAFLEENHQVVCSVLETGQQHSEKHVEINSLRV